MQDVAVAFDLLAEKLKIHSRLPTTGNTESSIVGLLARKLHEAASDLREDHEAEMDALERQQAEEERRREAEARQRAASGELYDPAEHSADAVNQYLDAHPEQVAAVLELERTPRDGVPANKQQRAGVLGGRHAV